MQVELLSKMHVWLCLYTLAFVLLSMAQLESLFPDYENRQVCGRCILRSWEGNTSGSLVLQWSCYLTFSTYVNQGFPKECIASLWGRKLNHLLADVIIGPGMLACISSSLVLVLLQILPVEMESIWTMQGKVVPANLNLDDPTCFQSVSLLDCQTQNYDV